MAAAYRTMAAMGLLPIPEAYAGPPELPPGNGRQIVIIGAGIAGMVLAWELRKAGYAPLMLEARDRARRPQLVAARAATKSAETDSVQRVRWDAGEHLYFNPGPARLPYHHQGILSYCRELGVPLEVMCNDNRGALLHDDAAFDGRPQRNRAGGQRHARLHRRTGGQGGRPGRARAAGQHRGQGAHARAFCAPSARSTAT